MLETLSITDIIIRLGVAFVLSAAIGFEREWYRKPAGLRTLIIVGLGSALFTLASFRIRSIFPSAMVDPSRIAAQIVTGIGFLGAGTIIRARGEIVGLTTAASIFVVAAIGMTAAFGLYAEAIIATVLVLFVFYILSYAVQKIRQKSPIAPETSDEDASKQNHPPMMH